MSERTDKPEQPTCQYPPYPHIQIAQLIENGLSPRSAEAAANIERMMAHIRRSMVRRELGRQAIADLKLDIDIVHLEALGAIEGYAHAGEDEVTVGTVAERLGIDPSRASRLVAEIVDKGLAVRVASQADARRICLELSEAGRAYRDAIHEYKAWLFAQALREWPEDELVEFSRLFERFSRWVADSKSRQASHEAHFAPLAERLRKLTVG